MSILFTPGFEVAICLSFFVTIASVWLLRRVAGRAGLLDHPGGRKQHERATPVIGGLAMASGLTLTWVVVPSSFPPAAWVASFLLLVALGAIDDRLHLNAAPKFLVQAFVTSVAVAASGVSLGTVGELAPGWAVSLGWLAIPFSAFAVVSVMNAMNMSDGVDGLAGSLMLIALIALALAAGAVGRIDLVLLATVPLAALAAFLLFNFRGPSGRPARIFMGDAGSLGLGFLIGIIAIKVASTEHGGVPPGVVMWVCFVPLADGLTVIGSRLARRAGAAKPGRDHLHHLLLERGLSPAQVVLTESGGGLIVALAALAGWRLGIPEWVFPWVFLGLLAGFALWVTRAWSRIRRPVTYSERVPTGAAADDIAADRVSG